MEFLKKLFSFNITMGLRAAYVPEMNSIFVLSKTGFAKYNVLTDSWTFLKCPDQKTLETLFDEGDGTIEFSRENSETVEQESDNDGKN